MLVHVRRAVAFACVASGLAGCSSTTLPATAKVTAPLPYTDRQVRETCRPGHTVVYRVERDGEPPTIITLRVLSVTDEAVDVETRSATAVGRPLGPPHLKHSRWDESTERGVFPRDATSIEMAKVTTPAGTYDSLVYTVRRQEGLVERFYFAKDLPGPPLIYATEKDGVRTRTSTVVSVSDQQ